ncbi:MAG: hypothetical protein B7Y37_13860 [Sphingobacteriia bacterium 28-36-52]|nr:MAG: hypothetical protein B7Y37_13860 [Sphingobacteriia bacterium 28-36-52]
MAYQSQQYITLDSVVNNYLDQSEQGVHKYYKIWQLAFRGLETLGLDFFYTVKSVKLPVNPNKTVSLPSDYVKYTKIGVLNGKGEIVGLTYNNKLTTFADLLPDRQEKTEDNSLFGWYNYQAPIFYNYWDGIGYAAVYGLPSGGQRVGEFKIDNENNLVVLNEHYGYDYLMVEYISSPQEGGDYKIPVQFREALIAYLGWQDIALLPNTRRGSYGDKEQRKRNFYNERRLANARYKPLYLEEAYELNLQMQRITVKG